MRDGEPKISTVVANLNDNPIDQSKHFDFYNALEKTIEYYESFDVVQ